MDADLPTPTDAHDHKLLADVRQYGWHVVGIGADADGPGFAFTVGLYRSLGHPEVIVFGLPMAVMHPLLNSVGERAKGGERFVDFAEAGGVLEGCNVIFREVDRRHYRDYLGYANWFHRGDGFPAVQCVWPDRLHRFPWHPEFPPPLAARQPLLADPAGWAFQAGKNRAVFTTAAVLGGQPVRLVAHDADGDWQFLCGTTDDPSDGRVVALGQVVQRDPSLGELADLPAGWSATRASHGSAWERMPGVNTVPGK